jgi:hypothetical protein
MARSAPSGFAVIVMAIAVAGGACTCSKGSDPGAASDASGEAATAFSGAGPVTGLSAPIAATRIEAGDVVVAGLDVPARSIRVQRINPNDEVTIDRTILEGVLWSSESDLKVVPAARGVAVTWRGLRGGKLVRQMIVLGPDLSPQGEIVTVAAASCATRDALWFTDGKRVHGRPWSGQESKSQLPRDKEAALVCGQHRAFALLDEDDGTSVIVLGGGGDAGAAPDAGHTGGAGHPGDAGKVAVPQGAIALLKESEFGEDDQRECAEYTVGDDLGVVRLAASGAIAMREVQGGIAGPLRKLKTTIPRDDDVVAVDASARGVVVVFTEDVADACGDAGATVPSTRVKALRIDRATFDESVVELSPGACGREVGPFFTGVQGDNVSVAWVERVPVKGQSRAPVAGLAHRLVVPAGPLGDLVRADQPADALVDAGCDGTRCYAVALARRPGMDAMVPGLARVIRY